MRGYDMCATVVPYVCVCHLCHVHMLLMLSDVCLMSMPRLCLLIIGVLLCLAWVLYVCGYVLLVLVLHACLLHILVIVVALVGHV